MPKSSRRRLVGSIEPHRGPILYGPLATDSELGRADTLAALVAWLPAWVADRIMTSVTLVGVCPRNPLAQMAGGRRPRSLDRGALGLNPVYEHGLALRLYQLHTWGMPFSDHARGLVAGSRSVDAASCRGARCILTFGYFCHLVSLGLTVVGLLVLSVAAPPVWMGGVMPTRE